MHTQSHTQSSLHIHTQSHTQSSLHKTVSTYPVPYPVLSNTLILPCHNCVLVTVPTAAPISPSGAPVPGTSTLINLRWYAVPPEHLNGVLLFYLVEVTEVITNTSWTFHAVNLHINIGPLHAYYTYRCRLAAFTVGVGPFTPFFYVNSGEACKFAV